MTFEQPKNRIDGMSTYIMDSVSTILENVD